MRTLLITIAGALAATSALAQANAPHGDAASGKQLFAQKGCYSCHGFVGQGSREGPRLQPPIAFPAFIAQLRTPRQVMPPYEETLVSDRQVADIYAYLANQPKPPDPRSIDLLK